METPDMMKNLHCLCCGRPFVRTSPRGPAPRYCSQDCRRQMEVRRRAWAKAEPAVMPQPAMQAGVTLPF
jgi:predicted nucleic acid-binding Zn ribbon protein